MRRKNVLHVIDSLGRGGAENLLVNYVRELSEYNNYILYFHEPHDLKPYIANAQVICLKKSEKYNALSIILKLRRIIREENINIVHAHTFWSNIYSRFATPRTVKLINHYHFATYDTMRYDAALRRRLWIDKITYSKRIRFVAVSKYVESILRKEFGDWNNIETIQNFIGDYFYKNSNIFNRRWQPGAKLKLIAIGSLKKEKNYELLVESFKTLKDFPVSLDIYGGGERMSWFRNETQLNNIFNLRFMGNANNVQTLFTGYDGYVMCSFSEACPLAPLEAMSSGLPLILSDIPSLKEIADDNALFFQNKSAESFTVLIKAILSGEKNLGFEEAGYRRILEHYSKDHFITRLIELYER